jgi:hypothetical protein
MFCGKSAGRHLLAGRRSKNRARPPPPCKPPPPAWSVPDVPADVTESVRLEKNPCRVIGDWEQWVDPMTNRNYYYQRGGTTQWEAPLVFLTDAQAGKALSSESVHGVESGKNSQRPQVSASEESDQEAHQESVESVQESDQESLESVQEAIERSMQILQEVQEMQQASSRLVRLAEEHVVEWERKKQKQARVFYANDVGQGQDPGEAASFLSQDRNFALGPSENMIQKPIPQAEGAHPPSLPSLPSLPSSLLSSFPHARAHPEFPGQDEAWLQSRDESQVSGGRGAAPLGLGVPRSGTPPRLARKYLQKLCVHKRRRYYCKDCGGKGMCFHGRRKNDCNECRDGDRMLFRRRLANRACSGQDKLSKPQIKPESLTGASQSPVEAASQDDVHSRDAQDSRCNERRGTSMSEHHVAYSRLPTREEWAEAWRKQWQSLGEVRMHPGLGATEPRQGAICNAAATHVCAHELD